MAAFAQNVHEQETVDEKTENEQLKQELELFKRDANDILQQKDEIIEREMNSNYQLTNKYFQLKNEHYQLRCVNYQLTNSNIELQTRINKLEHEKSMTINFKRHLQSKGEVCEYNCVISCLVYIYERKYGMRLCERNLDVIIVEHMVKLRSIRDKNKDLQCYQNEDLQCNQFMQRLILSGIVPVYRDFDFTGDETKRKQIAEEAWKCISTVADVSVLILGMIKISGIGHCVVCNNQAEVNGLLYDPQNEKEFIKDFEEFSKEYQGLRVCLVSLEKLKEIIEPHEKENLVHFTRHNPSHPSWQPSSHLSSESL
ncbi:uncharacterized protein LOC124448315 [Xenia sp. Carnegie-2017]|uniref:uncharacterized protein LOC124448315 n=1 Tax=Xenia sp. Carnegie-2017 TaxID=2897299 RepID=UPI001F04FFA1|nr:uncharacterized protein LOC124448315 [Xenia sp. Carnegie-2017]